MPAHGSVSAKFISRRWPLGGEENGAVDEGNALGAAALSGDECRSGDTLDRICWPLVILDCVPAAAPDDRTTAPHHAPPYVIRKRRRAAEERTSGMSKWGRRSCGGRELESQIYLCVRKCLCARSRKLCPAPALPDFLFRSLLPLRAVPIWPPSAISSSDHLEPSDLFARNYMSHLRARNLNQPLLHIGMGEL